MVTSAWLFLIPTIFSLTNSIQRKSCSSHCIAYGFFVFFSRRTRCDKGTVIRMKITMHMIRMHMITLIESGGSGPWGGQNRLRILKYRNEGGGIGGRWKARALNGCLLSSRGPTIPRSFPVRMRMRMRMRRKSRPRVETS